MVEPGPSDPASQPLPVDALREPAVGAGAPPVMTEPVPGREPAHRPTTQTWLAAALACALIVAVIALWVAFDTRTNLHNLELELVRREQGSSDQAAEARSLAKQAEEVARDGATKLSLLEARMSEVTLQRSQLDELIQSLSRSRDENVVADIDAAIRVAMQQSALTGSAEPLLVALRSADERLARLNQPRLERLRRGIARDLDRVRGVGVTDLSSLLIKLDEVVRLVDELPLTADGALTGRDGHSSRATGVAPPSHEPASAVALTPEPAQAGRAVAAASGVPARAASAPGRGASAGAKVDASQRVAGDAAASTPVWRLAWSRSVQGVADELRNLLRVTRIHQPEAMLLSPDQGVLLRENLKLRLLNARLSILSRQLDSASADLQGALGAIHRYFDAGSRKTQVADDLLHQIAQQSRLIGVPRPDDTLAALAGAVAGR
ncbi:MAG: uroporphyrinogen-III C-methyltransferase [Leptothrix sp. (in: b-proteobacteria)]